MKLDEEALRVCRVPNTGSGLCFVRCTTRSRRDERRWEVSASELRLGDVVSSLPPPLQRALSATSRTSWDARLCPPFPVRCSLVAHASLCLLVLLFFFCFF
jgi:hypothetical protein